MFVPQIVMGGTGSTSKVSVLHKLQSHRLLAKGGGKGATGGLEGIHGTREVWKDEMGIGALEASRLQEG